MPDFCKPTSAMIDTGLTPQARNGQSTTSLGGPFNSQIRKTLSLYTRQLYCNHVAVRVRFTSESFRMITPSMMASEDCAGLQYYGKEKATSRVCNNWTNWIWGVPNKKTTQPCWHIRKDWTFWVSLCYLPAILWVNWSVNERKKWNTILKGYKDLEEQRTKFYNLSKHKDLALAEKQKKWELKNLKKVVNHYYKEEKDLVGTEVFILLVLVVLWFHIDVIPKWFAVNQSAKSEVYDESKHKLNVDLRSKDVIGEKFGYSYFGSSLWNMVYKMTGFKGYVWFV